jgi:hypothetical protein
LVKFKARKEEMAKARKDAEEVRDWVDRMFKEKPKVKVNGLIKPNMCLEEAFVETYVGSIPEGLPITV